MDVKKTYIVDLGLLSSSIFEDYYVDNSGPRESLYDNIEDGTYYEEKSVLKVVKEFARRRTKDNTKSSTTRTR